MMKSKRRGGGKKDITPMGGIALLLLVFFIEAPPFKPPEQKAVTLPTSTSQRDLPKKNFITVTVTKDDSIYVDYIIRAKKFDPAVGDSIEIPAGQVGHEIKKMRAKAMAQGIRDIYIVLKADKDASYGVIEKIMDGMQGENLTSFQVVTDLDRDRSRT